MNANNACQLPLFGDFYLTPTAPTHAEGYVRLAQTIFLCRTRNSQNCCIALLATSRLSPSVCIRRSRPHSPSDRGSTRRGMGYKSIAICFLDIRTKVT